MSVKFHPSITVVQAAVMAAQLGCALKNDGRGNLVIAPAVKSSSPVNKAVAAAR
jgi:hypothetical protein